MPEPRCIMCGALPTGIIIDGAFRASVCDDHQDTTWDLWLAQRRITHPARPPRREW